MYLAQHFYLDPGVVHGVLARLQVELYRRMSDLRQERKIMIWKLYVSALVPCVHLIHSTHLLINSLTKDVRSSSASDQSAPMW